GTTIAGSPGLPNHIRLVPTIRRKPKAAIHGLRRPAASAIAPSTGDNSAITRPAAAAAKPHIACPDAGSDATRLAKYGANTNVVISLKYGCAAQSNSSQPTTAERAA